MAEKEKLAFPIGLYVDILDFGNKWKEYEKQIQAIINKSKFNIKVNIDNEMLKNTVAILERLQNLNMVKPSSSSNLLKQRIIAEGKAKESALLTEQKLEEMKLSRADRLRQVSAAALMTEEKARAAAHKTAKAKADLATAEERTRLAILRTAAANDKLTTSFDKKTQSVSLFKSAFSSLPSLLASYISVMGAMRFVKNIKEITAEFELQRVALAAIIQDKYKADELFAQTIELGLESPFQIKELITFTKQLAAYRIETENLFDTTSRLADISAGLGVDMSRLILAYGQVRAASVLRGQELRQFTEAGIPLVDLLAKKFSKLKGEVVSTADVFDLIRRRAVPFSMIKEIFEEMTDAGGVFYNMQEIQAKTLRGMWSNLRDAYDKMYMQMGEANMGLLKGITIVLKEFADNWQMVFSVITKGVAVYGVYKLAIIANTVVLGKQNKELLTNVMLNKRKEAANLKVAASYRGLTAIEAYRARTSTVLTNMDVKQLIASGKITKDMWLRMIATKQLTKAQQELLITEKILNATQVKRAASSSALRIMTTSLGVAFGNLGRAVKTATKALLANPYTWIIAAIGGVVAVISKLVTFNKKYNDLLKETAVVSGTYATDIKEAYEKISETVSKGFIENALEKDIKAASRELQDIIEKNESLKPLVEDRLKAVTTEVEKMIVLKRIYDEIQQSMGDEGDELFVQARKETGGWLFNADIVENTNKLKTKIKDISAEMVHLRKKGLDISEWQKDFKKITEEFTKGEIDIESYSQKMAEMNKEVIVRTMKEDNSFRRLMNKFTLLNELISKSKKDYIEFAETIKANILEIGDEKINWADPVRYGLTEENFNLLQTKIAIAQEMFFRANKDILARDLISNAFGQAFQIPYKPIEDSAPDLGDYEKAYKDYVIKLNKQYPNAGIPVIEPTKEDRDLLKEAKANLEEVTELYTRYNNEVAAGNDINKAEITIYKDKVDAWTKAVAFLGGDEAKGGNRKDSRVEALEKEVDLLKDAYNMYLKYSAIVGKEEARRIVEGRYGSVLPTLGIGFSAEEVITSLDKALSLFSKYGKENSSGYWKAWEAQSDMSFDVISKTIKENLNKLKSDIEQTQAANEFYEKMFGLTGDAELAASITKKLGFVVGDVRKGMYMALGKSLKGSNNQDYGAGIDLSNIAQVQVAINKMKQDGLKDSADLAQEQLNTFLKYEQAQIQELFKGLEGYATYEQKKEKIIKDAENEISKIRAVNSLDDTTKQSLIAQTNKRKGEGIGNLDLEKLQKTDLYIQAFEDLDRVGGAALDYLYQEFVKLSKQTELSKTDLKTITDLMYKITAAKEQRTPFVALAEGFQQYKAAFQEWVADQTSIEKQNALVNAAEKLGQSIPNILAQLNIVAEPIEKAISLVEEFAEGMGVAFGDKTNDVINSFKKGFKVITGSLELINSITKLNTMLTKINTMSNAKNAASNIILASSQELVGITSIGASSGITVVSAAATGGTVSLSAMAAAATSAMAALWPLLAVAAAIGGVFYILGLKAKRLEREQESLADSIDNLQKQYEKLKVAADDLFGAEYVRNMNRQYELLLASQKAALEQAQKEEKKGKKKADEKAKQYYEDAEKYAQEALDVIKEMQERIAGTSLSSAAEDFASAWLDAYLNFEDTADAISGKFKDMMNSLIKNSLLAQVVKNRLEGVFKAIKAAITVDSPGGEEMTVSELRAIASLMKVAGTNIDKDLTGLMKVLESSGFNFSRANDLTGLSKAVATMSEESALTLAGYANQALYYLAEILNVISSKSLSNVGSNDQTLVNLYIIQSLALTELQAININTGRSAEATEGMLDFLSKISQPGGKAVNVNMIN